MSVLGSQGEVSLTSTDVPPSLASTSESVSVFNPSELLSRVWQRSLPLVRERVSSLERLAQEATTAPLSGEQRTEAADIAHKLAGSLGMFGFPEGTEIARAIEHAAESGTPLDGTQLIGLVSRLRSLLALS